MSVSRHLAMARRAERRTAPASRYGLGWRVVVAREPKLLRASTRLAAARTRVSWAPAVVNAPAPTAAAAPAVVNGPAPTAAAAPAVSLGAAPPPPLGAASPPPFAAAPAPRPAGAAGAPLRAGGTALPHRTAPVPRRRSPVPKPAGPPPAITPESLGIGPASFEWLFGDPDKALAHPDVTAGPVVSLPAAIARAAQRAPGGEADRARRLAVRTWRPDQRGPRRATRSAGAGCVGRSRRGGGECRPECRRERVARRPQSIATVASAPSDVARRALAAAGAVQRGSRAPQAAAPRPAPAARRGATPRQRHRDPPASGSCRPAPRHHAGPRARSRHGRPARAPTPAAAPTPARAAQPRRPPADTRGAAAGPCTRAGARPATRASRTTRRHPRRRPDPRPSGDSHRHRPRRTSPSAATPTRAVVARRQPTPPARPTVHRTPRPAPAPPAPHARAPAPRARGAAAPSLLRRALAALKPASPRRPAPPRTLAFQLTHT